jgi:peptidoglycan-N-acetylglucosamine deacetylase
LDSVDGRDRDGRDRGRPAKGAHRDPEPDPVAFTFDMDAESLLHVYFNDTAPNRVAMASMLRYGPEVAVPRIVDAFRRFDLRQTFFVPGWCLEHYPQTVRLLQDHGHEIAHHGYMHEKLNPLAPEDERACLRRGIEAIVTATGRRPRGFRAPSWALLASHTRLPG